MRRGSKWLVLPVTGLFLFGVFSGPESRTWAMDAAAAARETGAEVDEPPEMGQVPDTMDTTGEIVVDEPDGMFDAVEAALSGDGLSGIGDIETYLRQELGDSNHRLTFGDLMRALASGNMREAASLCLEGLRQEIFGELQGKERMAGRLLALGLFGALFAGFSEVFSGGHMAETGFFLTYLMAFALLAAVFRESAEAAARILDSQIQFMKVLLPSYFTAVVWSGAGLSSAAWYEAALFLIAGVQKLYAGLLLSLVRIYFLSVMAGSMVKEDMLSRMLDLLKSAVQWGSRSLIGLVLGFQLVQGMVLPYADSVKNAGMQRLLQAIPGIGAGAGAVTKLMLGSGVLIKNAMGAAAVLLLFLFSIVPLARLFVLYLIYRGVAAVLQPVADKRLVVCLSGAARAQKMLLTVTASCFLLFAVTIALICQGTNAAYLAS